MPTTEQASSRSIVLIGFMGSGKSTVGRRLAQQVNEPFVDLDSRIEEMAGDTIANIFALRGETLFREIETRVLEETIKQPGVIATGGGIVTQPRNREILQQARQADPSATVVYLRAKPETLAARIRRQPGIRPLIDGDKLLNLEQTVARVRELLALRTPLYEGSTHAIIDTDERSMDDVVQQILTILQSSGREGRGETSRPSLAACDAAQ